MFSKLTNVKWIIYHIVSWKYKDLSRKSLHVLWQAIENYYLEAKLYLKVVLIKRHSRFFFVSAPSQQSAIRAEEMLRFFG